MPMLSCSAAAAFHCEHHQVKLLAVAGYKTRPQLANMRDSHVHICSCQQYQAHWAMLKTFVALERCIIMGPGSSFHFLYLLVISALPP